MTTAPAAVIASPTARPTIVALLATLLVAGLAMFAFSTMHGVENRLFDGLPQAPAAGAAVDQLVNEQRSSGRTCRTEPALTNRVVFQHAAIGHAESARAEVLTLADAVTAVRTGQGSIQSYCF